MTHPSEPRSSRYARSRGSVGRGRGNSPGSSKILRGTRPRSKDAAAQRRRRPAHGRGGEEDPPRSFGDAGARAIPPWHSSAAKLLEGLRPESTPPWRSTAWRAWGQGLDVALPRLVSLLARHRRVNDLTALRRDHPADARRLRGASWPRRRKNWASARSVEALVRAAPDGVNATLPPGPPLAGRGPRRGRQGSPRPRRSSGLVPRRPSPVKRPPGSTCSASRSARIGRSAKTTAATDQDHILARVKPKHPGGGPGDAGCLATVGDWDGRGPRSIVRGPQISSRRPREVLTAAAAALANQTGRKAQRRSPAFRRAVEIDPKQLPLSRQLSMTFSPICTATDRDGWEKAWEQPGARVLADPAARLIRAPMS